MTAALLVALTTQAPALDLQPILAKVREESGLVSMGAAVYLEGWTWSAVVGTTKVGGNEPVSLNAKWHLGSNTKSITATLAALLVQDRRIKWESTIGEVLGKLDPPDAYKPITLWQLLTHTSGVTALFYPEGTNWWDKKNTREGYAKAFFKNPLKAEPGTKFEYSNAGYILAGAMMEKVTRQTWETLIQRRIFRPLGIRDGGFGVSPVEEPGTPWPHEWKASAAVTRSPSTDPDRADNAPVAGPAGTIHMGHASLLKYLAAHMGDSPLKLTEESRKKLHTAALQSYGGGWIITNRPWAKGLALTHSGSNTLNFQTVWVAPNAKFAIAVSTNDARPGAPQAADKVIGAVIRELKL